MLRKDFRVLAFWLGSIATDANGHAHDRGHAAGVADDVPHHGRRRATRPRASAGRQNEIRINKPLMLTPAFPRFLAVGDKAYFGAVVHSQLKQAGTATVTIKSLDPAMLEFDGEHEDAVVDVAGRRRGRSALRRVAKAVGSARMQMTRAASTARATRSRTSIPVRVLVSPETVAAYGEAKPQAKERSSFRRASCRASADCTSSSPSTAMVGLGEGARYLVELSVRLRGAARLARRSR